MSVKRAPFTAPPPSVTHKKFFAARLWIIVWTNPAPSASNTSREAVKSGSRPHVDTKAQLEEEKPKRGTLQKSTRAC